ncbi:MAG: hypothetical protein RIM83_03110 [Allomuricauda sp.]
MNDKIGLIDSFMRQTLSLVNEYPNYEEEIKSSSVIVYIGLEPTLNISEELDKEIKDKIQSIFNNHFGEKKN